ncbi:hypothetical protein [Streptomyces sp. Ru72]|uniref:hypothetical protein n=1 Tax=Streptomyces sp. Ru72 TaxID=2080747 RepID=UPI0011B022C9|nr:hypothetical protein [Streptomyces sp. Ru72]
MTVHVTPAPETLVEVGAEPFAWRRTLYGPQAWQCPYDDDLRNEAVEGGRYALRQLADQLPCVRVVITEIVERAADTGPGDVKFAAAMPCGKRWACTRQWAHTLIRTGHSCSRADSTQCRSSASQATVANERCGQASEGEEVLGLAFVAAVQASAAV